MRAASSTNERGAVMADTLGKPIAEIGAYRPRAPYKPITLGALAGPDGER